MDVIRRSPRRPARLAVFPGSYNPPTWAHLALAEAALSQADEVLFVLPRAFPHKSYSGATLEQRLALLEEATAVQSKFSLACSDGGLFLEIARECRAHYPKETELLFLCGRDAAERIVSWDYGDAGTLAQMFDEFCLLVARRAGEYQPPPHLATRILTLPLAEAWEEVSATAVRESIAAGVNWQHLVPPSITRQVEAIYGR